MLALAIDLGDKRTGLAAGGTEPPIVSPLPPLLAPLKYTAARSATSKSGSGKDAFTAFSFTNPDFTQQLITVIAEHQPDAVVIGLPLNMNGTESPRAKLARAYAEHLKKHLRNAGLHTPVHLHDERGSSQRADELMAQTGLTHKQKKMRRDSLAAAAILTDFFHAQRRG